MLNKKLFHCFIVSLLIVVFSTCLFVFSVNIGFAADTIIDAPPTGEVDCSSPDLEESERHYCGDYELDDFVKIFVKYYDRMFGLVGSIALLFFIYGGVMFLISGGSSERVTKAKTIIVGAVIGIFIVFTSYMIIGFVFQATGADISGTAWSNTDWFE